MFEIFIISNISLLSAFISGIFGMLGGLLLFAALISIYSLSMAMILHGILQGVSNGWRALLLRHSIQWPIVTRYLIGASLAFGLLLAITYQPDKSIVFIILGLTPVFIWLPKHSMNLDICKKWQAEICGLTVQVLNTMAGVAGPLLDLFYVHTAMTRQQIVATKAITQLIAHIIKVIFWSIPLIYTSEFDWVKIGTVSALSIPMIMVGTWVGGKVLAIMSDHNFQKWSKWLITLIGGYFLYRGLLSLI